MALERSTRSVEIPALQRLKPATSGPRGGDAFTPKTERAPLDWIEVMLFLSAAFLVVAFCVTVLMATDAAIATARVLLGAGAP